MLLSCLTWLALYAHIQRDDHWLSRYRAMTLVLSTKKSSTAIISLMP